MWSKIWNNGCWIYRCVWWIYVYGNPRWKWYAVIWNDFIIRSNWNWSRCCGWYYFSWQSARFSASIQSECLVFWFTKESGTGLQIFCRSVWCINNFNWFISICSSNKNGLCCCWFDTNTEKLCFIWWHNCWYSKSSEQLVWIFFESVWWIFCSVHLRWLCKSFWWFNIIRKS